MIATALAVAFVVYSCKGKLGKTEAKSLDDLPMQTVEGMFVVHSENGKVQMRMEAELMERYKNDSVSYELFPNGFSVFANFD